MTRSKPVFIDASGWIARFSSDDRFHEIGLELFDGFGKRRRRLVTTDWVIAETGNGLARTRARAELAENMRIFLSSPSACWCASTWTYSGKLYAFTRK